MGNYTDFQGREILVQIKKRAKNPNPKSISTIHPHTAFPAIRHGDRTGFPVMVMLFGCIDGDKAIACKKRYHAWDLQKPLLWGHRDGRFLNG